jgi:hypothetical protein
MDKPIIESDSSNNKKDGYNVDEEETEIDEEETDEEETDEEETKEEEIKKPKQKKVITDVNEAIYEYYKLKQKMDKQYYKSSSDKQKLLCVNCNKEGGTYFSNYNGYLKAFCGSSTPCKLNIQIEKKGKIVQLRDLEYDLHKKINEYKKNMIIIKMNLIFGYETEDNTIELFKNNNKLLTEHERLLYECHNYLSIVTVERNDNLQKYKEKLENEIKDIRHMTELFVNTKEPLHIKEIITKYVDIVYPLITKIHKTKYHKEYMDYEDKDEKIATLVQDDFNIEETEMYIGDETKIISFIR